MRTLLLTLAILSFAFVATGDETDVPINEVCNGPSHTFNLIREDMSDLFATTWKVRNTQTGEVVDESLKHVLNYDSYSFTINGNGEYAVEVRLDFTDTSLAPQTYSREFQKHCVAGGGTKLTVDKGVLTKFMDFLSDVFSWLL